jgi:hypothetical protein
MKLNDGCPGCNREWGAPKAEGQCSRCKRCIDCCNDASIVNTCANRFARKDHAAQIRSTKAYNRFVENPNMLKNTRRIT